MNLSPSLTSHSRAAHSDLLHSLLDHARQSLLFEKQLLKEVELLRPELKGIKKPQAGVIYHTMPASPTPNARSAPSPLAKGQQGGSPTLQRTAPPTSSFDSPPSPSDSSSRRTVGRGAPDFTAPASSTTTPLGLGVDPRGGGGTTTGSMAQKVQPRTVRSMASSVVVEGDRRQRVDVSSWCLSFAESLLLPLLSE